MKKLLFAILTVVGSVGVTSAQESSQDSSSVTTTTSTSTTVTSSSTMAAQDDQVQIKAEDLPAAVKTSLEDAAFKGWIINAAYHVRKGDKYIVELKNGADTKKVTFNKDGNQEKN